MFGSVRSSQAGSHQIRGPAARMIAGSSTSLTIVASSSTAIRGEIQRNRDQRQQQRPQHHDQREHGDDREREHQPRDAGRVRVGVVEQVLRALTDLDLAVGRGGERGQAALQPAAQSRGRARLG